MVSGLPDRPSDGGNRFSNLGTIQDKGGQDLSTGHMHTESRLERAQARLDKALGRLESAVAKQDAQAAATGGRPESTEVARLEDENARLRETTHLVARRLDSTVGRLKAILEA